MGIVALDTAHPEPILEQMDFIMDFEVPPEERVIMTKFCPFCGKNTENEPKRVIA